MSAADMILEFSDGKNYWDGVWVDGIRLERASYTLFYLSLDDF
jgi:hypothetical protein